jgi:hypothetical protein
MLEKAHFNVLAERSESELCEFEALHTEGDADYCDAEKYAEEKPRGGNKYTAEDYPQKIT